MNKLTDIINGCKQGDNVSVTLLYNNLNVLLKSICLHYFKDNDTVQEVVHKSFMQIYDKIDIYDFNGSFEGWCRKICKNKCIDTIRKNKMLPIPIGIGGAMMESVISDFSNQYYDHLVNQENIISRKSKMIIIHEEIEKLSPCYKQTFKNYVFEEMSHIESAKCMGLTEGTSKSNYFKAKRNLRNALEKRNITL